ncbi:uncharacterized protein LOC142331705 [Lycorma delicatula]|uniref:uncharacterized protein LOC142331705 n=1 Tax=Lycorma delicatula TaxID=130591 RepID=UPI003F516C25
MLPNEPNLSTCANSVVRLVRSIPIGQYSKVYFDNWYTKPPVLFYLQKRQIHAIELFPAEKLANFCGGEKLKSTETQTLRRLSQVPHEQKRGEIVITREAGCPMANGFDSWSKFSSFSSGRRRRRFNPVCCGCDLETCCKIIAWCSLIESILVTAIIFLAIIIIRTSSEVAYKKEKIDEVELLAYSVFTYIVGFITILWLIVSVLLIKGVYNRHLNYMLAWIILMFISIIFYMITKFWNLINNPGSINILESIAVSIYMGIKAYTLFVILSFYIEIRKQQGY